MRRLFLLSVLLISAYFPPDGEVGGRRIAKLCEHFPAFDVSPSVLTMPVPAASLDPVPEDYLSGTKVCRVAGWPDPARYIARLKHCLVTHPKQSSVEHASEAAREGGALSWRSQALAALYMPDAFIRWYWPAKKSGARICERNATRVLISSGPPWTCHLIANSLKRKYGLAWVADFRDPWTACSARLPNWRLRRDRSWEKACIAEADVIVCNTERLRQMFIAAYPQQPASKFVTITNGFEPSYPSGPKQNRTRRFILHTGTIYGTRRIDTFCQALKLLLESEAIERENLEVMFLGDVEAQFVAAAERATPSLFANKTITFQPRLPWKNAQKLLWAADVHLIVQGQHRLQVPAKFFECLQTGMPILAIADEGALSDAITETGAGFCAESDDVSQIAGALMSALKMQARAPEEVQRMTEQFHWRSITARFSEAVHYAYRRSERSRT